MKQNAPVTDFFAGQGLVTNATDLAPVIALPPRCCLSLVHHGT